MLCKRARIKTMDSLPNYLKKDYLLILLWARNDWWNFLYTKLDVETRTYLR